VKLKSILDDLKNYISLNDKEMEIINANLIGCPKCNENLEFKWSYCIDPDCCDWPHIISCIKCEFDVENYNAYDLVKEFLIVPSLDEA